MQVDSNLGGCMRNKLFLALCLALPGAASASPECVISFSGAQQDVCSGKTSSVAPVLQKLQSHDAVKNSTLRVVKFSGPITSAQRAAVEAAGAQILDYAPYYSYIVRMPASRDGAMLGIDGVIWSGPLMPAFKVDANIFSELNGAQVAAGLGIDSLQISLAKHSDQLALRETFSRVSGLSDIVTIQSGDEMRLMARFERGELASAIEQLAVNPDVLSIGFHRPKRLSNSQGHWLHQSNINTPTPLRPVWNQGIYGCGQIVGELDTGLYQDNVAFKDATQTTPVSVCDTGVSCPTVAPNLAARKVVSYYKWSGDAGSSWADEHGHGTHVAGSILGNDNVANPGTDCVGLTTPGGSTNLDGMAPGAKLVMQESGSDLRYLNNTGGTPYHAAQVAYANGARIHSNSWGGGCTNIFGACVSGCTVTYDDSARDADRVTKDFSDLLMVFAAGNDGTVCPSGNNVGSPGNAKNVLTIGATSRGAAGNAMAGFSSRGPALDSRTKPDLTAQGASIVSAGRSASGTATMSGTSMATPTASGLAALVRDYLAQGFYPGGVRNPSDAISNPSGSLIKAILLTGAVNMTGTGAGTNPGQAQGFGRIHLDNSLHFLNDQTRLYIHDSVAGLSTGGSENHQLVLTGGQPFSIALTWADDAAAIGASPATVNSLRLEVVAPNGDVWSQKLPAGYNVNNATPVQNTTTANYDNLNTVHRINFTAPETGTYTLRVSGINVPSGTQKYALAAAGNFIVSTNSSYALTVNPGVSTICAGSTAEVVVGAVALNGFTDPVALTATGLPTPATGNFSVTPIVPAQPAATSLFTISGTAGIASGDYNFTVEGISFGITPVVKTASARLVVDAAAPAAGTLATPANGASNVATAPSFTWTAFAGAAEYRFELSTDPNFATHVVDTTVTGISYTPAAVLVPATTYYWRVTGINACDEGEASAVWSFATANEICKTVNLAIPDNNATGVSDTMTITDPSVLVGMKVAVKATHTWVGDLSFKLAKDATSVTMVDRPGVPASTYGCNNPNVDIVLDDEATQAVETQCNATPPALSGAVRPNNAINTAFAGASLAGTWTLTATDGAGGDTGSLTGWCLIPDTGEVNNDIIFADGFDIVPAR